VISQRSRGASAVTNGARQGHLDNRRSNCSRASPSRPDEARVATPTIDGSIAGRTQPRDGAATASVAMTFCSSRTFPGQ